MSPKTKNLLTRTASGAVYIALMIAGVFMPPFMAMLMCLVSVIGVYEFCEMTSGPLDRLSEALMMLPAFMVGICIIHIEMGLSSWTTPGTSVAVSLFMTFYVIFYVMVMSVAELFRRRPCPIEQIGKGIFGLLWIVLPLGLLAAMTFPFPKLILAFLLMIWGNDTFAYLGGSTYGKHKMFERISPKKTWEGTLTGVVMTVVMAVLFWKIPFFADNGLLFSCPQWIILALLVSVFGTLGDLLESLFKRNAGIKDSGKIMPGHGGILDRFDSILFSATPVCIYFFLLYCSGF